MLVTPNFDEAVEMKPLLPGIYSARVIKHESTHSKKGDPMIKWTMVIFGATGDMKSANDREISAYTMMTGKGAGKLRDMLKATGLPYDGSPFDPDEASGKEVQITLKKNLMKDGSEGFPDVTHITTYVPF